MIEVQNLLKSEKSIPINDRFYYSKNLFLFCRGPLVDNVDSYEASDAFRRFFFLFLSRNP